MRSKECLENEKPSFYYYDLVKKAVCELYPIRTDKSETVKYFNLYLFADARFNAMKENNNGDNSNLTFELMDGEVDDVKAYPLRTEILHAIINDESFIYAYNIIVRGDNLYSPNHVLKGNKPKTLYADTPSKINEVIRNYKEDYPKKNLFEYLTDADNNEFYENRARDLKKNDNWWLEAFNLAYEVFDRFRVYSRTTSEALKIIEEINTDDEMLDRVTKEIICYMCENYSFDITKEKQIMLRMLSEMVKNNYEEQEFQVDVVFEDDEDENLKSLTCSQQTKGFLFLFDALGVNEGNTKKSELAKLIQLFTGKNLRNIQNRMKIDFNKPKDVSDLKLLSDSLRGVFPDISNRIDNYCNSAE
ncbi:MAG: hypothetical protein PHV53_04420 [Fermentimonas sp.]|nr:hypothetical protein [Fermentimonas sp.]